MSAACMARKNLLLEAPLCFPALLAHCVIIYGMQSLAVVCHDQYPWSDQMVQLQSAPFLGIQSGAVQAVAAMRQAWHTQVWPLLESPGNLFMPR